MAMAPEAITGPRDDLRGTVAWTSERISARVEAIRDDLLQVEERPRARAGGVGRAGGVHLGSGLDPFDALRHAREVGLELGETVVQGGQPVVRGRLVVGRAGD